MHLKADVPKNIKPLSIVLSAYSYWGSGPFANTMLTGQKWSEFSTSDWGTEVFFQNPDGTQNPQFNANGYPQYLNPGKKLRLLVWPYNVNPGTGEPSSWPKRGGMGVGKWVVTWQGDADIRLNGRATFVAAESSGASTGRLVNGRRVYIMGASNPQGNVTVEDINAAKPITDMKVWLPDPSDSQNRSLEGEFWHPTFVNYLSSMDFNHLRFMAWEVTNSSPVQDWCDRRLPGFCHQTGILNRRSPAEGIVSWTDANGTVHYFDGDRQTGIAYEHMISLCNTVGKDMWISIPHMVTDDYVTKLARLIRFGSDGVNPYTSPQTNPVYPPLDPSLRVWVEYSNEIWSNGDSFSQGNWAAAQAAAAGITKAQFIARRYARIWQIFQQEFDGASRIVRVAGIWTASTSYTLSMLTELKSHGESLTPAVAVDAIAPTTYFGNGIQDWAYEQANLNRGTNNQWFHTSGDFVANATTGATRPVSVAAADPYWTSTQFAEQEAATFEEWKKRIFSGSTAEGGGPDSTGVGGGFDSNLPANIFSIFGRKIPLVAYEGGPSLYTDSLDGADVRDDGVTLFTVALNRRPEFAEIYRIQLNMALAKGLTSHAMFTDTGLWGKYGQWGHLEYPDQPLAESVKWNAVKDWVTDISGIRPIDDPAGSRPTFVTAGTLPSGAYMEPYSQDIVATGGDIANGGALQFRVIGSQLSPGLALTPVNGDPRRCRISGSPQSGGWNYFYLRVQDDDGDASWQIYSFYIAGGPGTLVEADISGTFAGAVDLPWKKNRVLSSIVTCSGLDVGSPYVSGSGSAIGTDGTGVRLYADSDALRFSVSQGTASSANSTLSSAITDNEYWKFTVTPKPGQSLNLRDAEFRLSWVREEYYGARNFVVMSSVGGFAEGQQIYTLSGTPAEDAVTETVFHLPTTTDYANLTAPVEFRIYFYGSQYSHKAKLLGLKLSRDMSSQGPVAPLFSWNPIDITTPAIVGKSFGDILAEMASDANDDLLTFAKTSGPEWLSVSPDGAIFGTPGSGDQGVNTFTVRASDPGGLTAAATLHVTVKQQVAKPVILPASGSYASPITVSIGTATSGATICYTTDGSTPTASTGMGYTAPFVLGTSATLRAIGYKNGFLDSEEISADYTISSTGRGTFQQTGPSDIVIEAENFTSRATNGDTKEWYQATAAVGYQGSGYIETADTNASNSAWTAACEAAYEANFTTAGTYYLWVRVNWPDTNGNVIYTGLDEGTANPSGGITSGTLGAWGWLRNSTAFSVPSPGTHTIRLRRRKDGARVDKLVFTTSTSTSYLNSSSAPVESAFTVNVATPVASPAPGSYPGSVNVSLATATPGASIRYTTDGSLPTSTTGTLYAAPFVLNVTGTTIPVNAIAFASGGNPSEVTAFHYTILDDGSYQAWANGISWSGADSSPAADPDGDGLNNLMEYAFLSSPKESSPNPLTLQGPTNLLHLSYLRARANVTYTVETSSDLVTWTTNNVTQDTSTPVGSIATATIPNLSGPNAKLFFRLLITKQP